MTRLIEQLEELGIHVDAQLFELAMSHRSWAYENGQLPSNERLEFLGDAVLQIIVTEYLYATYSELAEGQLAKLRASVVSAFALAQVARELQLGEHIKLGRGEELTGGRDKESILADTTEALIGAIHLTGGRAASERFVHAVIDDRITESAAGGTFSDFKTSLQELCAHSGLGGPVYAITSDGPDHLRVFTAEVLVEGVVRGAGVAPSKKRAEQLAATEAYKALLADA